MSSFVFHFKELEGGIVKKDKAQRKKEKKDKKQDRSRQKGR